MSYITYHNHDTMSLLDSCLKTKDLVKWAVANKMNAVGVTNHGEMSSLLALHKLCEQNSIKPILGIEFYVTENKLDENGKKIRDNWHLIALCKNQIGWDNMIKLHNLSWSDGRYYYDPRITLEDLIQHKEGLIITSACIGGVLGRPWMNDNVDKALDIMQTLKKEFGEDFYLELQNHNDENLDERKKQHDYNKFLIKYGKEFGIKCVIQNDSHYYLKEDWEAHQVLLCKNTGSKLSNPKFKFGSKEYYLKNEAEMVETFNEYPLVSVEEYIKNTQEIADKVETFVITNKIYDCPTFGEPEETYAKLIELIKNGLAKRFTKEFLDNHPEYLQRIKYELSVVKKLNFVDYFLMLEDLISYTNKNNIYVGVGRGSCVGSLILYCLGVVQADPIKYNLLFERFLNEDRISMCDADIDIADVDRQKVIEYVKHRFGEDHVCNIGTYGELTAKASLKAVASVLEIPFSIANSISNIMDSSLTLKENYDNIDEFKKNIDNNDILRKAYKMALTLEGTYAQRGTHACGMVISSKPLDDVCACVTVKDTKTGNRIVSTSNEMKEVDGDLKLLKMDYLGLRNLSILKKADEMIHNRHGLKLDYKNLDTTDKETYEMLSQGNTLGVFQFESTLMRNILKQMQPESIEDLSCVTSLARPGCMGSGITQKFLNRKNGREKITSFADGTEDILQESLQLPIYQEQIMMLSRKMAGFTGSEADYLRKCITGDSIISLDNDFKTIEYLYKNKNKYIGSTIFSTNKDFKTTKDIIVDIFDNGTADVYKIKTQKGYELKCTNTHELMMLDKFRKLKDIKIGDSIAINKKLLLPNSNIDIDCTKLRLIAMIIGDGCISGKQAYFCNTDKNMVDMFVKDFNRIYGECNITSQKTSTGKDIYYIKFNKNKDALQDIKHLINGINSSNKKFGDYIYSLNNEQYINIIAGLIDTDGSISLKDCNIEYASKNKELIEQIVNILSKVGIYAKLYIHNGIYKNKKIVNYRAYICGEDTIKLKNILENRLYSYKNDIIKNITLKTRYTCSKYNIPKEILPIIHDIKKEKNLTWANIDKITNSRRGTMSSGINFTKCNQGISKQRLQNFNIALKSKFIENILNSDVIWDKIISIEYIGEEHVYDLQTEKEHNYIANNIVVHNCIGKKDPVKLKAERGHFVGGCVKCGYDEDRANEIFDGIEECGSYLFNKSHSIGYSLMSYATAYYKVHYPVEYMCALLNSVPDDIDKLNLYISECFRMGIQVLPPNINISAREFVINENNEIVFGLNAIKGLGKATVTNIINARKHKPFDTIEDFIQRSNTDKGSVQALLRVGALNDIVKNVKRWDVLSEYINEAKNSKRYIESENLIDSIYHIIANKEMKSTDEYQGILELKRNLGSSKKDKLQKEEYNIQIENLYNKIYNLVKRRYLGITKYTPQEKMDNEQEYLGFNVTVNPYLRWTKFKKYFITKDGNGGIPYVDMNDILDDMDKYADGTQFHTVALLSEIKELKTKKGQKMARLTFEYYGKKTVVTVFPNQWQNNLDKKLKKGNMVLIVGYLTETNKQYNDEDYEIRAMSIQQLNVLINADNKCIIDIDKSKYTKREIDNVIKRVSSEDRRENNSIERAIFYKTNNTYPALSGLCWINNPNKLENII